MFVCLSVVRQSVVITRYKHRSRRLVEREAMMLVTDERNIFSGFSVLNEKGLIGRGASCLPLSHRKHNASSFSFQLCPNRSTLR